MALEKGPLLLLALGLGLGAPLTSLTSLLTHGLLLLPPQTPPPLAIARPLCGRQSPPQFIASSGSVSPPHGVSADSASTRMWVSRLQQLRLGVMCILCLGTLVLALGRPLGLTSDAERVAGARAYFRQHEVTSHRPRVWTGVEPPAAPRVARRDPGLRALATAAGDAAPPLRVVGQGGRRAAMPAASGRTVAPTLAGRLWVLCFTDAALRLSWTLAWLPASHAGERKPPSVIMAAGSRCAARNEPVPASVGGPGSSVTNPPELLQGPVFQPESGGLDHDLTFCASKSGCTGTSSRAFWAPPGPAEGQQQEEGFLQRMTPGKGEWWGATRLGTSRPLPPWPAPLQVEGRWLTLQLSASHANLVSPADPLRLALHSIQTRDGGDVDFVLFWKGEGVCKEANITVHPTQLQGQYQGSFEGGSMHIRFVSTDYSNLVLYVRFEDDEITSLWVLLARRMQEDPKWVGRYLEYVEKFHLQKAPVFNIDGVQRGRQVNKDSSTCVADRYGQRLPRKRLQ
ncbi:PREDICTED: uncharacterized protein LOC105580655 [Cercocebus atys]|uniref:uncharacterized protein LOC105580655 n=1 Tax=Cercocebus atys TaxID=9531 RepID=UPI0005F37F19|nr:PREDICTED: uncharacterized protein LOC105580655 [Cercocebus atys]